MAVRSAREAAYETIRSRIITMELKPGDELNDHELAQELGINTVAEGVEHAEQVDFLRAKGCNMVQGYAFARPMPEAEFNSLLDKLRGGAMPLAQA